MSQKDPSAGLSSPSPAELAAEALRDFLGQDWCAGAETRLQALVRSVEERVWLEARQQAIDAWSTARNRGEDPIDAYAEAVEALRVPAGLPEGDERAMSDGEFWGIWLVLLLYGVALLGIEKREKR